MLAFQPEKYGIVKRSDLKQGGRYNSTIVSADYGKRMLPLPLALQFARHLMKADGNGFREEAPYYCGLKALLLRRSIASMQLKELDGKHYIKISNKSFTELFELHEKFLAGDLFIRESQLILFSEGWTTRTIDKKTGITTLGDGGGAESYSIPPENIEHKIGNYDGVLAKLSDFPFLFGKDPPKDAKDVIIGFPKGDVNGGNAVVGCGPCNDGVIIPRFEWNGSVFVYES